MTTDDAILLDDVAVRYRLPTERISSLKEFAIRAVRGEIGMREFYALKDISLRVARGSALGIVGHNGAGKSTLLTVISRVITPTRGRVRLRGRVAPLLELGAGFDNELTGRENILLNGTILGFSRQDLLARQDRIIEFAGLRKFIDAPLRTYSSGMVVRLGFSIATDVQPDILIVDEVLGVGRGGSSSWVNRGLEESKNNYRNLKKCLFPDFIQSGLNGQASFLTPPRRGETHASEKGGAMCQVSPVAKSPFFKWVFTILSQTKHVPVVCARVTLGLFEGLRRPVKGYPAWGCRSRGCLGGWSPLDCLNGCGARSRGGLTGPAGQEAAWPDCPL